MKKYATLLPKKLASRDPGDACVEEAWQTVGGRERISEINWNFFKTSGKLTFLQVCLKP
ncbi:hypothetical protein RCO48_23530 [Peribacillus frigoritolerans]|nr:hypothetical protein [Peribacillus frigoritolerans]